MTPSNIPGALADAQECVETAIAQCAGALDDPRVRDARDHLRCAWRDVQRATAKLRGENWDAGPSQPAAP